MALLKLTDLVATVKKPLTRLRLVHTRGPLLLVASIIGLFGGIAAIIFHASLEWAIRVFRFDLFGMMPWPFEGEGILPIHFFVLLPPLGALVSGLIVHRFAQEAAGDGTYTMIDNFHRKGGFIRKRVPFVKWISSVLVIASGGSAGQEGPVAQIGSGLGSIVTRFFHMNKRSRRIMMLAGTAAGLSAVFKAPLGAALTSVEVLYHEDFESDAFLTSIISAVIAYSVFAAYAGTAAIFHDVPIYTVQSGTQLLSYALLGVICAPVSWFYVKFYYGTKDWFTRLNVPVWIKPALGAVGISVLWIFFPQVLGGSWHYLSQSMKGAMSFQPSHWAWIVFAGLMLAKIFATAFTVGSGAAGGVFGPSLFIGAMLGASVGNLLHIISPSLVPHPGAWILVGMGSFFAGAAKAPLASVVMVCELTGSYSLLAPLMIASVIHIALSQHWSLYKTQVENKFQSPAHRNEMRNDVLMNVLVSDILPPRKPVTIHRYTPLKDLEQLLVQSDAETFPILDMQERLVGILDVQTLRQTLFNASLAPLLTAEDLMYPPHHLRMDNNLHLSLKEFLKHGVSELPVLNREGVLCGMLRYRDVSRAYDEVILTGKITPIEVKILKSST